MSKEYEDIKINEIRRGLEYLLIATPTGDIRNGLTDINTAFVVWESMREDYERLRPRPRL